MAWLNGAGAPLNWRPLTVRDGIAPETPDTSAVLPSGTG
jgi:hypothetical protein